MITAKDGGSVLREEILSSLTALNEHIMYDISVPYNISGKRGFFTYQDLCMSLDNKCFDNGQIQLVRLPGLCSLDSGAVCEITQAATGIAHLSTFVMCSLDSGAVCGITQAATGTAHLSTFVTIKSITGKYLSEHDLFRMISFTFLPLASLSRR